MFDYVEQIPDSILKTLMNIVAIFFRTCTWIVDTAGKTLQEIIVETMENLDVPEKIVELVNAIFDSNWAWIYHFSLLEILLGGALIVVVLFGIIKYFTDIIL